METCQAVAIRFEPAPLKKKNNLKTLEDLIMKGTHRGAGLVALPRMPLEAVFRWVGPRRYGKAHSSTLK